MFTAVALTPYGSTVLVRQVFTQKGKLYGFKGLVGRLAPIAVHVSLLMVLGGSGISALATNEGSAMIPQGSQVREKKSCESELCRD